MNKYNVKKGFEIGLGFTLFFLILFSIFGLIYAVGFHNANEILPGTFSSGNFSFNGNLTVNGTINVNYSKLKPFLHIVDEKSTGTDGGTFTSGSWQIRTLNTVKTNEIDGASLSSNVITLPAGTYYIEAAAPAFQVTRHKARLYNINTTNSFYGTSEITQSGANQERSLISEQFTISGSNNFRLEHRSTSSQSSNGFGYSSSLGVPEIYSEVKIWKLY